MNGWTPASEALLQSWQEQIKQTSRAHAAKSAFLAKRHKYMGVPAGIMGAFAGSAMISMTAKTLSTVWGDYDGWIRLGLGIMSICSTALSGSMMFLRDDAQSEKHKLAADSFDELARSIETTLKTPKKQRLEPGIVLNAVRTQYNEVVKWHPRVDNVESTLGQDPERARDRRCEPLGIDVYEPRAWPVTLREERRATWRTSSLPELRTITVE